MKLLKKTAAGLLTAVFTLVSAGVPAVSAEPLPPLSYVLGTEGTDSAQGVIAGGDCNGDGEVTAADAVRLQRHLTNSIHNFSSKDMLAADLNLDGAVNVFDLALLKRDIINMTSRTGIVWQVNKVPDSEDFRESLGEDKVIADCGELLDYIQGLYKGEPADGYIEKYNEEYFENNVLFVKTIVQTECEDILHTIGSVRRDGSTLSIDCVRNYDSLRSYGSSDVPLMAEITVPRSLYHGESVVWNMVDKDWELGYDEFSKGPITEIDNTFEFKSPDGKDILQVRQTVKMSSQVNYFTEIHFTLNGVYKFADLITSSGSFYTPFSNEGSWVTAITTDGHCITNRFESMGNYEIFWKEFGVSVQYNADKSYKHDFYFSDPVLMVTRKFDGPFQDGDVYDALSMKVICNNGTQYKMDYKSDSPMASKDDKYLTGMYDLAMTYGEKSVPVSNPEALKAAVNNVKRNVRGAEMTNMGFGADDYGSESLYLIYPDSDMEPVELCRLDGNSMWLDNEYVQELVKLLVEEGYFGSLLEHYFAKIYPYRGIVREASEIPFSEELMTETGLDKNYVIGSVKELRDFFLSVYPDLETTEVTPYHKTYCEYMKKYDDAFFDKNVLLIKPHTANPTLGLSVDSVYYNGDVLRINYSEYLLVDEDYVPEAQPKAYLAQVAMPINRFPTDNVYWVTMHDTIG